MWWLGLAPFLLAFLAIALSVIVVAGSRDKKLTVAEGRRLLESGQTADALAVFDKLARRARNAPQREAALYWLGQTLETLGRRDGARRVYLRYLADYELAGDGVLPTPEVHEQVRAALADILQAEQAEATPGYSWKRYRQEEMPARQSQSQPPPRAQEAHSLKEIRALMEAGRFQAALGHLARHVARPHEAPGREAALHLLGLCYEGLGRPEQARAVYRRYMREYGTSTDIRRPSTRILLQVAERLRAIESGPPAATEGEGQAESGVGPWARFKGELRRLRNQLLPEEDEEADEATAPEPLDPEAQARQQRALDRGLRVGDYVLAEKLGDGGFGEVFRALRPVAIKFARDPEAIEHLRRFAEVQGKLSSARIVRPLEVNLESDPPYVVMEFVDGATLRDLLRQKGALPVPAALPILREVALGLQDAHRAGALHLDLKPENVLLDARSGAVKLTDFELGLSPEGGADQVALSLSFRTKAEHLAGTLAYMSPEQRAGRRPDARSDLFTFGVILFEALTGTLPEPGDKPSDFAKDLPRELDQLFERCFARHERRYASADELVRDLEAALARTGQRTDLRQLLREIPRRPLEEVIPRALAGRITEPEERVLEEEAAQAPMGEPASLDLSSGDVPPDLVRAVAAAAALVEEAEVPLAETEPALPAPPVEPVAEVQAPPVEPVADVQAPPVAVESPHGANGTAEPVVPPPEPIAPRPPIESFVQPVEPPAAEPAPTRPPLEEVLAARAAEAGAPPVEETREEAPVRALDAGA